VHARCVDATSVVNIYQIKSSVPSKDTSLYYSTTRSSCESHPVGYNDTEQSVSCCILTVACTTAEHWLLSVGLRTLPLWQTVQQPHLMTSHKKYVYVLNSPGSNTDNGKKIIFPSLNRPDWHWSPPNLLDGFIGAHCPWVKRLGRKAVQSYPFSAEVMNEWGYTSNPPISLQGR